MSRFLGPIHHWLFNKIILHENLEKNIKRSLINEFGEDIKNIHSSLENKYGNFIENKPLEDLINTNNIHGWLQNRINISEGRLAEFITISIDKYNDKAYEIIKNEYINQGSKCGKDAKDKYDISSAPSIYKTLNNYILDGMPCDNVNNIVVSEIDLLEWKVVNCLHKKYWESIGGNINIFYELKNLWIKNFVQKTNDEYNYTFKIANNNILECKISKK